MDIILRRDLTPDADFYYRAQFKIYQEPYLIWDKYTWERVLRACTVYRIEINGKYAGDVILQAKKGIINIVDFGIFPEYQGKGIGKAVLNQVKEKGKRLLAVTREERLDFFLKCGFALKRTAKDYYAPGVNGYYIFFDGKQDR